MKNFFEKLFDLIYDYIDYIIMLAIIIIVVAIIGWRLDLIFTDDGTSVEPPIEEEIEEKNDEDDQVDEEETEAPEDPEDFESETEVGVEVEIQIPSGTMPPGIGNILVENNLIDDSGEFLNAIQEQNLETGLKAGIYIIPSGSSLNEILEILTN